ncbi:NADPH-dependent FMN reductase [Pedobacter sp. KR3-3]|uniref:NADPH-dependent FMN reductase n=1 Tax=Pedobacter albus TaxID=3113905 RepID=A0ABU7I688_9SPHI|nr:NADPH-dependent FMN reductase [Pedobacter sp. KR3-3]MEE1944990.1 NADPH-dependent FMN reductase [Pedobacter sp. KR3-3]
MEQRKNVLAIIGSTRANSSNLNLVKAFAKQTTPKFEVHIFEGIGNLPHFNPDQDTENPPEAIVAFRKLIAQADALLICTPEYVFSLPGSLKNAIEWCVSTTLLSQKPTGLITASASGLKAHEELQLVMRTVEARFTEATTLLIPGIKGKFDTNGNLIDEPTIKQLKAFELAFEALLD